MKALTLCLGVALAAALAGCNTFSGGPEFKRAAITPETLQPGDLATITVEVADRHGVIDRIEGMVLEDPEQRRALRLERTGEAEGAAGRETWSMQVDVPFQAPPGEFNIEFTAFRADGLPVTVRDAEGRPTPLRLFLPLYIGYADE